MATLIGVNQDNGTVWQIDNDAPSFSTQLATLPSGLTTPLALVNHDDNLYVFPNLRSDNIYRFTLDTIASATVLQDLPSGASGQVTGAASFNNNLYVVLGDREIWRVDPSDTDGSNTFQVGRFLISNPRGMTEHNGRVYIILSNSRMYSWPVSDIPTTSGTSSISTTNRINHGIIDTPSSRSGPRSLASDGTDLYTVFAGTATNELVRINLDDVTASTDVGDLPSAAHPISGLTCVQTTVDAVAPTLTLTAGDTEIDDDETTLISVAASGGTYDEITYAFSDAASGAFTGSGAARTYNPAGVNAQTVRTVTVTATATGTGTEAADNTSDDSTASIDITVNPGLSTYEVNGRCRVSSVPAGTNRTMTIRCCIQGQFGDGTEGLLVEWRPGTSGSWTQAAFIHGWTYSNSYETGDSITDENGVARTIVANGGWIDVDVSIPNNAGQVALQPKYIVPGGQDTFHHDIAIRSIAWS